MRLLAGHLTVDDLDDLLATLDDIAAETNTTIQTFDADYVVSEAHLERALAHADRAIDRGENVARERAVEVLCYAAGRRQINRALAMGVAEGENRVVLLVDSLAGDDVHESRSDSVANEGQSPSRNRKPSASGDNQNALRSGDAAEAEAIEALRDHVDEAPVLGTYDEDAVREFFDIGDAELAAVEGDLADLVLERVALLDVEK
jgi:KEOPS complex subunit Cgi121